MKTPVVHITPFPNSPSSGKTGRTAPKGGGSAMFIRVPYPGLDQVLQTMKELVDQGKGSPFIREKAVQITSFISADPRTGLPNRRNFDAIAHAVYEYMKKNIQYVRDPDGIEWIQTPEKTLELGFGDCDDQAVLAGALLSSIGVPTRFKVVKADPQNRGSFTHVFLQFQSGGIWKGFDPTLHSRAGDALADNQIFGSRLIDLSDADQFHSRTKTAGFLVPALLAIGALIFIKNRFFLT